MLTSTLLRWIDTILRATVAGGLVGLTWFSSVDEGPFWFACGTTLTAGAAFLAGRLAWVLPDLPDTADHDEEARS
ncbi:hypothetical protein [Phytomonospora endophytica]|uniref:Uncharacterized protein n=1 Tax=Phytomonospora endophytica TaxID=714109 RepID=A0A841FI55_9ACTN|nr:hypothetical protein [Phytomonospora endophytica]MBB6033262.1 hypothetical protein [Phytomonospora endophytica]GIG65488.1 hypothetical protein Pen01_17830 [Phytomonospora endophytica]